MTDLFFCPDRWEPDPLISTNAAKSVRIRSAGCRTADAWQLGDWGSAWTAITSRIPMETGWLEAGCEYRFCFWLNGGENSRGDEVCSLEIFGDDWENRLVFPLNRDRTRPLLYKDGWLLYAVPFTAPAAAAALNFRFVAAGAVCTVAGIADMDMASCERMVSEPPESGHPMRHNIVYPGGWKTQSKRRCVLKAHGKALSAEKALLIAAAAAGIAAGAYAVYCAARKNRTQQGILPGSEHVD